METLSSHFKKYCWVYFLCIVGLWLVTVFAIPFVGTNSILIFNTKVTFFSVLQNDQNIFGCIYSNYNLIKIACIIFIFINPVIIILQVFFRLKKYRIKYLILLFIANVISMIFSFCCFATIGISHFDKFLIGFYMLIILSIIYIVISLIIALPQPKVRLSKNQLLQQQIEQMQAKINELEERKNYE